MPRISDCACAEKPRPPCSLEISMPRKPCRLDEVPDLSGISRRSWRMFQSLTMRHSSSVGPSRNARSSAVSVIGGTARSFSQSGVPENSSASKPMVPASSASCSVADTFAAGCLDLAEDRLDQRGAADRRNAQARQHHRRHPGEQLQQPEFRLLEHAVQEACLPDQRRAGDGQRPQPDRRPPHGQHEHDDDAKDDEYRL